MTPGAGTPRVPGGASIRDRQIVSGQLSRRDIQPFKVLRRCSAGYPMVIQSNPVSRDPTPRVFTTLYWLTCPSLIRHLSRYESEGWVRRVEDVYRQSAEVRENLSDLHGEYAFRRRRAVGSIRMSQLSKRRPKLAETLSRTGIAGVSDTSHVKCLHAHAAFHLVRGGHPLFETFPELLKDVADCRDCDRLAENTGGKRERGDAV